MAKRKFKFLNGNFYHVYNRGVDKRDICMDLEDLTYFYNRMQDFNSIESFGGVARQNLPKNIKLQSNALQSVDVVAFALVKNHFHFILKQKRDDGVSKFIHRLCTGHTKFFNKKYKRTGSLFQGKFKAIQIKSEGQLSYLSAYVNLNDKVHKINKNDKFVKTSWGEYINKQINKICVVKNVLEDFKNNEEYEKYAKEQLRMVLEERCTEKDKRVFIDD